MQSQVIPNVKSSAEGHNIGNFKKFPTDKVLVENTQLLIRKDQFLERQYPEEAETPTIISKYGYKTYLHYKKILELLDKENLTAKEIITRTGIPTTTVYHALESLENNNEIIVAGYDQEYFRKTAHKQRIFKRITGDLK